MDIDVKFYIYGKSG